MFFSRPYVRLAPVCVRSRACASVRLNPIIRPHPSSYVHVRLRPCPYVCIRALASAFVHVRASAFVCVHIIKSPDASACIISDASGRVFRSRTFKMHYRYYEEILYTSCSPHPLATPIHSTHSPQLLSILLTCAKFKVWMTVVESGWNVWVQSSKYG